KTDVGVYGTDVYSNDTPVCAAARHAGVMSARGGDVTVVVETGRPAYRGSERNGVASRDWGAYRGSFRFQGPLVVPPEPAAVHAPAVVDAGCSFEGTQIHGEPGSLHRVSCPSGCKADHDVWGTDTYSGHSRVCLAAIHAGLSNDDGGGEFTLILGSARPAFRGSKRNGVQSGDWGDYRVSFQLQR
ncbi:MAG: LCCL domain-containing protein, partial [Kofleriaceae bacterium]